MKRRATYEDLMQVPDHLVAEIIDGELVTNPRPASPHAWASSTIGQDLGPFSGHPATPGGRGGWWIMDEPELHFAADVVVPDLPRAMPPASPPHSGQPTAGRSSAAPPLAIASATTIPAPSAAMSENRSMRHRC